MTRKVWKPGTRVEFVAGDATLTGVIAEDVEGLDRHDGEGVWVEVSGRYWWVNTRDLAPDGRYKPRTS